MSSVGSRSEQSGTGAQSHSVNVLSCRVEQFTEREIVRFDPGDADATAKAQKVIFDSELGPEDQALAHFWAGYFYAHAGMSDPETDQPGS